MSKERTRRYRERLNQDEARREEILGERRKYQEKKAKGEIKSRNIGSLPKQKQHRLREVWRNTKTRNRKMKKDLAVILNETPPSPEQLDVSHDGANIIVRGSPAHDFQIPSPQAAILSTTPPPAQMLPFTNAPIAHIQCNSGHMKTHKNKLRAKMRRLQKENKKLQAELEHMKKANCKMRVEKHRWNTVKKAARQPTIRLFKKAAAEKKRKVIAFLSRDENSRLLAGKKDTVGRTHKMQRRVLTKTLMELHADYNKGCTPLHCMSYRQFTRYRPKYITEAKASDRNTCACYEHENMRLLIECLVRKGMIPTKSLSQLLSSITCNSEDLKCMYRQCTSCCFDEVPLNLQNPTELARWEQWQREEVTVGEKVYKNWVKKGLSGTLGQLAETFQHALEVIASHHFNWRHQAEKFRELKEKLQENDLALHIDFSENYACKLNSEIQTFHFGGNRQQVTIHTVVAYTKTATQSFATISKSLRHDERAVWAHLQPIIVDLQTQHGTQFKSLHLISDGPVTQYRNKTNCFLMSTVPFSWGFQSVTWNFSERGHGKGAPDGVGACVKRMADQFVQNGGDLQTPEALYDLLSRKEGMKIQIKWIEEKDIAEFDKLLPSVLPAVKGILSTHQIYSTTPGKVFHRIVSCFCNYPSMCDCFKTSQVTMTPDSPTHEVNSPPPSVAGDELDEFEQDRLAVGKFIIVIYDDKRYVGQMTQILGEEMQVNCMAQHGNKNAFQWPEKEDCIYYSKSDIIGVISEPEPYGRGAKLADLDWLLFNL